MFSGPYRVYYVNLALLYIYPSIALPNINGKDKQLAPKTRRLMKIQTV